MKDMDAAGDLIHEDPDRDMRITLRSTTLKGAIQNAYLELDTIMVPQSRPLSNKLSRTR